MLFTEADRRLRWIAQTEILIMLDILANTGPLRGLVTTYTVCNQWRNQPADSVPLCKYCHVYKLSTQSISKEMNNDNELKFAWRDQIVGQATPLCVIMLILERTSVQKKYYCTRIASAAEITKLSDAY